MAFYGELFRKKDEEDIWEELKRMLRNPPTEEEIALKKQQEQAKIDEAISRMFPDEPEPAKEPYLTPEELLSPQDAERYRQKQMVQNNLNASGGEPTGFAAPITQNKQGGLIGNTKVQQMFNKPTNLVNQNNNLVQGLGNSLTQGANFLKKQNTFPNLNKTSDLSNSNLVQGFSNIKQKMSAVPNLGDIKSNPLQKTLPQQFNNEGLENNNVISKTQKDSDTITTQLSKIKNIPQNLYNTAKNKVFEYANRDFDRNAPKTLEEIAVQSGIEKAMNPILPMASNATRNGMHDMEAAKQQENVKVYDNLESLEDTKLKDTLKRIGAKDSDKGAVYGIGSRESEAFSNSPELDAFLTKNRANVIAGKPLEDSSLYYDADSKDALPWNNPKKYDRYATARKITLVNPKVDENGIFTCDLVDYSNFDDEPVNSAGTYLNKWGYKMQEKGHYKPHYQVIKIRKKVNW